MPVCDDDVLKSADALIELALAEDLGHAGDLTSAATVPADRNAEVHVVAREAGVLCGGVLIRRVYSALCRREDVATGVVSLALHCEDGSRPEPGTKVATLSGPVSLLLTGERVALNFLIHLSGIATATAEFVRRTAGSSAVILDTRKTLPGYRLLQKYAVRCGGGTNHRMGLFDGMLIKDNHLAARGSQSVAETVVAAREFLAARSMSVPVEVEVDTLEQLQDALSAAPDIVLLDNMQPPDLQRAVALRNRMAPDTLLEASGGVNLENIGCISGTGVDRISIGAITHSAAALDISFDWPWQPRK